MRISTKLNNKKSQAAMEFLMTYGWAILVVLAAIAALAYFGVLSPAKFLPEKCILEPGFLCEGHKVETSKITLIISNTVEGRTVTVNSITVGSCSSTSLNTELVGGGPSSNFLIGGTCSNGAVKDRYKGEIVIGYTEKNTQLTKTMYGNLNSKVE